MTAAPTPPPTSAEPVQSATSYAPAVRRSAPAVVSIYTKSTVQVRLGPLQRLPDGRIGQLVRDEPQQALGSGVIVDAKGHIVTNDHVIRGADEIVVQLADGRYAAAQTLGRDPETDLAVLQIDLPHLPVMPLGRSDRLEIGEVVLAIGNPLGLSQTVTHGIVSFTGRALGTSVAPFESFIQTDAAINHGNSGGALVNAHGELIGINTAVVEGANGLGLAIPVDLVRGVVNDILEHKQVLRGWFGIGLGELSEDQARNANFPYWGVVVTEFDQRSPALQPGGLALFDKIETIDGTEVRNAQDTSARLANRKPGTAVKITGQRCVTRTRTSCTGRQSFSSTMTALTPPALTK